MKKIALCSLLACLSFSSLVWADCGYEEVRDISASDEDIFFASSKPDYKKGLPKAIVCGKQQGKQFCKGGTWIYVVDEHYNTTYGANSKTIYSCDVNNVNDNWGKRNLSFHSDQVALPKCGSNISGYVDIDLPEYDQGRTLVGKPIEGGKAYVDLCWTECENCNKVKKGNVPGSKKDKEKPVEPVDPVDPVVDPTPKTDPVTKDCVYKFSRTIKCANGEIYSGEHTATFSKAELGTPNCPTFEERFAHDVSESVKLADKVCLEKTGGKYKSVVDNGPASNSAALTSAKQSLDSFFASIGSGSGLRTADGKFNTTRLASDIAAGVVLGTVGGVVSGVVIKKKQVEKGFDALHCTVGGQKIADWGDTFEVGLQK